MFNFINEWRKVRRRVIVDEKDILTVLKVLDSMSRKANHHINMRNMEIVNVGRKDRPYEWFMMFDINNKDWHKMIDKMNKMNYDFVLGNDANLYLVRRAQ